jgi:hypothetical protein
MKGKRGKTVKTAVIMWESDVTRLQKVYGKKQTAMGLDRFIGDLIMWGLKVDANLERRKKAAIAAVKG